MKKRTAITPTRAENYPQWYQEVIQAADLAEHSKVRGCMIIKPWGFGIWELMQKLLDEKIKETGHQNAYFPLFVPLSYLQKEAEHVEGFAKECAIVTHHRLEKDAAGNLIPTSPLEEPLIIRPTSEMIIGEAFSRWIQSYRDLPLLINQWANVVRWEMRTRLFLRTTEFLWQEGHTAHATEEEAKTETLKMLQVYASFAKEALAIPVIMGEKTEAERFPGAVATYTIEAMMQDRKALQAATSHMLGQNFAKSCGIQFQNVQGDLQYAWTTSWGSTTRWIGALIMTHSDDDGLVLPPPVAPFQLVILPIIHSEEMRKEILHYCEALKKELVGIRVTIDDRPIRGGEKSWHWIKKGVPLRLEVGQREIERETISLYRRDKGHKEVEAVSKRELSIKVRSFLKEIQEHLYEKALQFQRDNTIDISNKTSLIDFFSSNDGFVLAHYCEDKGLEERMKEELNVSVRCIPLGQSGEEGKCIFTGKRAKVRAILAKAY